MGFSSNPWSSFCEPKKAPPEGRLKILFGVFLFLKHRKNHPCTLVHDGINGAISYAGPECLGQNPGLFW